MGKNETHQRIVDLFQSITKDYERDSEGKVDTNKVITASIQAGYTIGYEDGVSEVISKFSGAKEA